MNPPDAQPAPQQWLPPTQSQPPHDDGYREPALPVSPRSLTTPGAPAAGVRDGTARGDRRLGAIAALCIALSLAGVLVHALGLVSAPVAVTVVLLPVGVGLRVALIYAGRAAGSVRRTQVMTLVSSIGLGISALTLVGVVPHLTRAGGVAKFGADLFAHGWTLAIVTVAVGSVRTLGWRAFLGAGLTGFLAVPAIAALIGRPVVNHLGTNSGLATAGWAPLTEEALKALPVVLIASLAVRRRASRPSAADLLLLGLWTGAGFALFENAVYGRGGANWSAAPLASLLVPSGTTTALYGRPGMLVSGHMIHTGLIALGIAITLMYKGVRWRRWALPAAFLVALAEHAAVNGLLLTSGSPRWAKLLAAATLHGWLSIVLFIGGSTAIVVYEWRNATRRAQRGSGQPPAWLILSRSEIGRRGAALASLQLTGSKTRPAPNTGGQR
jgi:RsiW-degrading membrane proteinase PrsW (M82 family)